MGNTSVNDVGSLFASLNIGAQSLAAGKLSNNISQTGAGDLTSFKDILSQNREKPDTGQKQSGVKTENKTDRPAEKGKTSSDRIAGEDKADAGRAEATDKKQADKSADPKEGNADKTVTKGQGLDAKNVRMTDEETEGAFEALLPLAADFLVQISEILEITPDEANEILSELGLEAADLLNPQELSAFALRAMGAEDSLSLLTNETHFEQYQNINEALKEILASPVEGTDLTVGELNELVKSLSIPTEEIKTDVTDGYTDASEEMPSEEMPLDETGIKDIPVDEDRAPEVSVRASAETKDESKAPLVKSAGQAENSELKTAATSEGATLGMETSLRSNANRHENSHHSGENGRNQGEENVFLQNQNFSEAVQQLQTDGSEQVQAQTATPQEIANQIMDYMRSQVKPDMQMIEMQLHPASLGNIQISLIHKDGNLTASFACQDEQVRAVLENQMIQLQERFEEQGIKVNSIEVSVGSQAFEQNMEQQGHREEQQAANAPKRVRRLTLGPDFLAEDLEELEGDDRIAAEMMAANGGTMDVQV